MATARPRFEALAKDAKSRIKEVSPQAAADLAARGALLIDVREQEEFAKGRAQGARHISKGAIEMKVEEEIPDASTPLVCYCGGGNRSALVADNLQKMGYSNVVSMVGGFKAWQAAGLPVES